jgi:hypothetical protein
MSYDERKYELRGLKILLAFLTSNLTLEVKTVKVKSFYNN